jgi:hypothetical protein
MASKAKFGGSVIGLVFLALGVVKLINGDDWIVWIILGILFGGLGAIGGQKKEPDDQ